jgi:hypothetical protein
MPATQLITGESIAACLGGVPSRKALLQALGVSPASRNYARLEQVAEQCGLDLPPKNNTGKPGPRTHLRTASFWDEEVLRAAVADAKSIKEVVERLGLVRNAVPRLQVAAQEFGIVLPRGHGGPDPELARQRAVERTFRKGARRVSGARLKRYILQLGVMSYLCKLCSQGPEWNGKLLVLQLDHENGDCTDNRLENLRFLCPNCHSQTETFAGRNCGKTTMGNGVTGNTPGFGPGDDLVYPGSIPGSPATPVAA